MKYKLNQILLSPDAAQGTIADPFAEDVSGIKNTMPVLKAKIVRFTITEPKREPTKKDPENEMITFTLSTQSKEVAVDGTQLNPGFRVFHRIMITKSEKRSEKNIAGDLAEVMQAAFPNKGKGMTPRMLLNDPTILDGKMVDAKVSVEPEKDGYPEKNVVKRGGFVPLT